MQAVSSVSSQLAEAAVLMGVGMLFVFAFLTLLILAMGGLKRFVAQFPGQTEQTTSASKSTQPVDKPEQAVIAAISAAIHQYRQSKD
ncbi:OadG family protein [Alteromonas facilis]|uniref:OadG family protein n=1 Tax=Alteromonas facilis TaxID=2048004 RepID=UPI000C283390|nr:OadG family transporter subunit [Alteromonas facilis]